MSVDEPKLKRLIELYKQREEIEAEITGLLGGERPKRTWKRKAPHADQSQVVEV
jgi:hypothetical protein